MEKARICAFIHREEAANGSDAASDPSMAGRVALGLSGGPSSRAMLRLARERLLLPPNHDPRKTKPQPITAIDVLYVDDSAVIKAAQDRTEEVRRMVDDEGGSSAGLHLVPLRLEQVFEQSKAVPCTAGFKQPRRLATEPVEATAHESLLALFSAIRPDKVPRTALANARSRAEDMHRLLIMHILRREAVRRGASSLLTGENATRRAVRMIEGLGRGQGHKMPMEEAPVRWHGVFLLRPMADVSTKEVAFYLHSIKLEALLPQDLVASELLAEPEDGAGAGAGAGSKASISRLTESLINLLEGNVPGTASTVNRTSGKLVFHDDPASHMAEHDGDALFVENGFERIGPSEPLRRRRRRRLAAESDADAAVSELNNGLRGIGLGGQGTKMYLAVKAWPSFAGERACPLCQMPAQRGLQQWRQELTVSKRDKGVQADGPEPLSAKGAIDLSDLLCYACTLLLDTPETTASGQTMPLPTFVLDGARTRLEAANGGHESS